VCGRTSPAHVSPSGTLPPKTPGRGVARILEGFVSGVSVPGILPPIAFRDVGSCVLTEARRRAADIARVEAQLRADAAWQYSETFSRIYDETLSELLAEQQPSDAA
jgi:hypothetical protein